MPIHNEETLLPISLPSVYALHPREVLVAADRCTDHSEELVKRFAEAHPEVNTVTRRFSGAEGRGWRFRSAYLRRTLYAEAENNVIMNTSADLWLGPEIQRYLPQVGHPYGLVSFAYLDYPWTYVTFIRRLLNTVRPGKGFSGLLALSKRAWLNSEDLEDLKTIPRGEDTHLSKSMVGKYPQVNRLTTSRHLRPHSGFSDSYLTGVAYHDQLHYSDLKMLSYCLMFMDPVPLVGLRHARAMRGIKNWRQGDIVYCKEDERKLKKLQGCGHVGNYGGETPSGTTLCVKCAERWAEEAAYRIIKEKLG
jgi:hypothetical protein